MSTRNHTDSRSGQVDFDLHGVVGIRLLDATSGDVAAVAAQLGLASPSPVRNPDVVIRFVDRLDVASPLRSIGLDDAGFTDDAFFVLRAAHKARARVKIPFAEIGRRCELVCESGVPAVPLLIDILNLTMLAKGVVPIHASAFLYNGQGVLTVGWSQGGKTEALLAFMAHGARYIGDEWVYISRDGRSMWGMAEPICVWDWHLRSLPQFRTRLTIASLARLRLIRWVNSLQRVLSRGVGRRVDMLRRVEALLNRQLHVDVPPRSLFGDGCSEGPEPFDRLLLAVSHDSDDVIVRPVDPREVAARMAYSLQEERSRLMCCYRKFQFAFPGVINPVLELADDMQGRLILQAFAKKSAHVIYHPYPMELSDFFSAVSPLYASSPGDTRAAQDGLDAGSRDDVSRTQVL